MDLSVKDTCSNGPDPHDPKRAWCPFKEQYINTIADLERATGMGRHSRVVLDLSKPPPGSCYFRALPKKPVMRPRIDVHPGFPPPNNDPPPFSPYLLPNSHPQKLFIPGYSGFVPRYADKMGTYGRATHVALNEFTDSLLPAIEREDAPIGKDTCEEPDRDPTAGDRCPGRKRQIAAEQEARTCHIGCSTERPVRCDH